MFYHLRWQGFFFYIERYPLQLVTYFFSQWPSDVLVWLGPSPPYRASQHGRQFAHHYCSRQDSMAQWLNYWLPQQTALLLGCLSWLLRFLWLWWTTSEAGDSQWFGKLVGRKRTDITIVFSGKQKELQEKEKF